jgi:4-amino-4-deoxy-L-arabinose transferase-like glycosyltransferase
VAFWEGPVSLAPAWERFKRWLRAPGLRFGLDAWGLAVLAVFALSAWFRFVYLATVPPEMVSDHAEKLLDVVDILNGKYSIFFPRNTGREAIQFYLAAATANLLGTGVSYLTLKIGTALAGLLTLPYIYLFGKEVGGRKVGLAAMALAGVAYWPNVISRVGLRFPLYPLFAAPALYYLARGIRTKSRNDFLLCGLAVGIGLHGYTPARAVPIVVAFGVALAMLHAQWRGQRWALGTWLVATGAVAFVVALPLIRVAVDNPDLVMLRTLTRVGTTERPLPGPAVSIFASNLWNAIRMIGWDDGDVWVNSVPHRPALDWISAGLFYLGVAIVLARYVRRRQWLDLFVVLSIPVLMLPSILSLAFPAENPAPNRAAGAIIPVFVVAAIPLAALPDWAGRWWRGQRAALWGTILALGLFAWSARINYNLVFVDYENLYRRSAWNTSEMGQVILGFSESVGTFDTAHVVAFPYWVDTRMPGIVAGRPTADYAIWPNQLDPLAQETRSQLFIVNPKDTEGIQKLQALFPEGTFALHPSPQEGHAFLIYTVPARAGLQVTPAP